MADEKIRAIDIIEADVAEALAQVKRLTDATAESTRILTEETKKLALVRKLGLQGTENQAAIKKAKEDLLKLEKKEAEAKKKAIKLEKELATAKKKTAVEAKKLAKETEKAEKASTLSFKKMRAEAGKLLAVWILLKTVVAQFNKLKDTLILLDNFKFALEKLTKSSYETEENMRFLIATSKRFGTSLESSVDRYVKFFAAAKQANVSVEDTREIFTAMSNAAGTLGLKADETRGIFLALEQMFSKGKVTTEELRRQLGERLPGAFGIMADTMNKLRPEIEITVNDLDDMLKKGEVISGEVLPEFARQVEIAFGIQQRDRIDTLVAAQSRLGTAWTEFVFELENGGGALSNFFINFFNYVTKAVEDITDLSLAMANLSGYDQIGLIFDIIDLNKPAAEVEAFIKVQADLRRETTTHAKAVQDLAELMQGLQHDTGVYISLEQQKLDLMPLTTKQLVEQTKAIKDNMEALKEANKPADVVYTIQFYKDLIKVEQDLIDTKYTDSEADLELSRQSQAKIDIWNKQIDLIRGTTKAIVAKNKVEAIEIVSAEGLIEVNKRVVDSLTKLQSKLTDISLIKMFDGLIKQAKGDFSDLVSLPDIDIGIRFAPAADSFETQFNKLFKDAAPEFPISNMFGGQTPEELTAEYKKLLETEELTYEEFLKRKIKLEKDYVDTAKQLVNGLFDIGRGIAEQKLEDIQAEMEAVDRKYDALYDAAEGDKDHQDDIREIQKGEQEKLRKEELKQRQKIAKDKKIQDLANVAMNTAVAVSKVWGQTGIFGLAAQIPVLIMGALQAAVVAAQPIPKYATGTDSAKAGLGIVGDGGRPEIVVGRRGTYITPSSPTAAWFEQGDKVYKSEEDWKRRTNQSVAPMMMMAINDDAIEDAIAKGFKKAKINNWIRLPKQKSISDELWSLRNTQFS